MSSTTSEVVKNPKKKSSASHALQALVSKFSILAIGLITSILNARFLGAEGRGEQAAMLTLVTFIASIATLGIPASLIYNTKKHFDDSAQYVGVALLLSLLLGCLGTGLGIVILPFWMHQYSSETVRFAQLLMLGVPFSTVTYVCWGALEGRQGFWHCE
ncbi:MAG: oligosaccharide flippase family protein [Synechococcales cyanobacterium RM1_1_8]|nr:oligosaccharide flippase family protein [Synechococcales cyanobacterium RM1_1_8]